MSDLKQATSGQKCLTVLEESLIRELRDAEDHIAGLVAELDRRCPGWEKEPLWYSRASNPASRSS